MDKNYVSKECHFHVQYVLYSADLFSLYLSFFFIQVFFVSLSCFKMKNVSRLKKFKCVFQH